MDNSIDAFEKHFEEMNL